jgi:hypothetical protein
MSAIFDLAILTGEIMGLVALTISGVWFVRSRGQHKTKPA